MEDAYDRNKPRGPAKRGLLYRLSSAKDPEVKADPVESIVANLRSVLNSDRGIAPSCPELGLGLHRMLSDWTVRRSAILKEIRDVIEAFEPRLTHVEVTALGRMTTFRLSVLIEAELPDGQTLRLKTDMAASGDAQVQRLVKEV